MAQRPIEEHLADFLLSQKGDALKDYRRRCLAHWRAHYGEAIAVRVEAMVRERWEKKPASSAATSSTRRS